MGAQMAAGPMAKSEADVLAVRALAWMAADAERMGRFLAWSGAGPADLRVCAADPGFLGFVLDFVLADESALLAFADAESVPPGLVARARAALPGGDVPNWT